LKDVIVFSCKGDRSEANKISGSDLDGDLYFVCWDQEIVKHVKDSFEPGEFKEEKASQQNINNDHVDTDVYKLPRRKRAEKYQEQRARDPFLDLDEHHQLNRRCCPENTNRMYGRAFKRKQYFPNKDAPLRVYGWDDMAETPLTENTKPSIDYKELLQQAAAKAITPHGINMQHISIHELFDMRMRIIDYLGSQWKEPELTAPEWAPIIDQLFRTITRALDAAKTGESVETTEWSFLLQNLNIPKYPHFYPSQSKENCRHSTSAVGYIYDKINKNIEQCISRETLYSETEEEPEQTTDPESCSDTLYDAIYQLKFSFLLFYTSIQYHSDVSSNISSHQNPAPDIMNDNPLLEPIIPRLNLKTITEWYNTFIQSRSTTLIAEEAESTMLWKLMTLKALKNNADHEGIIVFIRETMNLSDICLNNLEFLCNSRTFICVNERLLEEIGLDRSNWVRETFSDLTPVLSKQIIDYLERLLVQNFWKDLGLPYPAYIQHMKCFPEQPEPPTFQQVNCIVNDQLERCLKPVYCCSPWESLYLYDREGADRAILDLRDSIGCLLCFPELWSQQETISSLSEKLAKFCTYYIHMCKYMKLLKKIRYRWANADNKKTKRKYRRIWQNFPVDTYDTEHFYICLSKLEVADNEMDILYSHLFHQ
jgi:hypothetical protein